MNEQIPKFGLQEIIADLKNILNLVVEVLDDHEHQIQDLKQPNLNLKTELQKLSSNISKLDPEKTASALIEFDLLCRVLGVNHKDPSV